MPHHGGPQCNGGAALPAALCVSGVCMVALLYCNHPQWVTISRASCETPNRVIFPAFTALIVAIATCIITNTFLYQTRHGMLPGLPRVAWLSGVVFGICLHGSSVITVCSGRLAHVALAAMSLGCLLCHCGTLLYIRAYSPGVGHRRGGVVFVALLILAIAFQAAYLVGVSHAALACIELGTVACGAATLVLLHHRGEESAECPDSPLSCGSPRPSHG